MRNGGVLAAALLMTAQGAFAASGGSATAASFGSALIVSGSASVVADVAGAGASFAVKTVETVADITRIVLAPVGQAAADSAEVVIEAAPELARSVALAAGDSVTVTAIVAEEGSGVVGHILTAGGQFLLYAASQKPMSVYSRRIDA
ncbi:MAG: hypothetical protein ACR2QC_12630 [Gammaproteobacteria bacterium]